MKVSIRYQIVGLVGAILMGAMASYVYLATSLVTRDKLASIYDFNSLLAGTTSEQVRANLTSLVDKLLYFGAEASGPEARDRARSLFANDGDVLSLEVWRKGPEGYRRVYRYSDPLRLASLNLTERDLEIARKETPLPLESLAGERVMLQNASMAPDVAILRLGAASADGQVLVAADLRPDRMLRIFGSSALHQTYLVNAEGGIVVHPDPSKVIAHADARSSPVVKDALDGKASRGAREFSSDQGDVVGSFARVDAARLAVIIEVPKREALRASTELAKRSGLFALFVVSFALFASIFFSRRLSAPLRRLQDTMARISKGEFGVEVPVSGASEIGTLGDAFNKMSRELSAREEALAEKNTQLIQSEKLSALGELSAGLAHEVKNPMVGIVGFSQLGLEATSVEEAREYFGLIESDAQRANGILQNLLEYARPQQVQVETLEPNHVVEGAVRLVAHQLQLGGVHLETKLTEGLPQIKGNSNQLRQVLVNLFMNAGQAMEGSPEKKLGVRTYQDAEGSVIIAVKDTGPGMSDEVKKKLFQPFFTTKERGKGTGLGLSVSSSIIAQHRGEIRVESTPGAGATFLIRLPAMGDDRPITAISATIS